MSDTMTVLEEVVNVSVETGDVEVVSVGIQGPRGATVDDLAEVAATGSYNDLLDVPAPVDVSGKADIAYVNAQDATVAAEAEANLSVHTGRMDNPHNVTKAQVGLGNVDNTADLAKPVSTATQTALNGKANAAHAHAIADVTGLQATLDGKQPAGDYATNSALATKANTIHTHAVGDVAGLQTALDAKQPTGDYATSTALSSGLATKANTSHLHALADVTGLLTALDGKQPSGDYATNTALTSGIATKADAASLAAVATTGSYTDLINKPTIPDVSGKADKTYVDTQDATKANKAGDTFTGPIGGTTASFSGAITAGASSSITGTLTSTGLTVNGQSTTRGLAPSATLTYNVGSTTNYYSFMYTQRLNLNSTAYIDGAAPGEIDVTATQIDFNNGASTLRQTWSGGVAQIFTTNSAPLQLGDSGGYLDFRPAASSGAPKFTYDRVQATTGSLFRVTASGGLTGASGLQYGIKIDPIINQSGTAGYAALLISPTETTTGSGDKLLINTQVGGANRLRSYSDGSLLLNSSSGSVTFLNSQGRLSIGFGSTTAATASVHIAGGTTTQAQLRFSSGVAPTTPNDGDIWYDGTDLKMRIGSVTKTFTLT